MQKSSGRGAESKGRVEEFMLLFSPELFLLQLLLLLLCLLLILLKISTQKPLIALFLFTTAFL